MIPCIQKINLSLGDDANGWEGTGMNDIWEVRKLINSQPQRFKKNGKYEFRLYNIMRDDPLQHIMNAGLRIKTALIVSDNFEHAASFKS